MIREKFMIGVIAAAAVLLIFALFAANPGPREQKKTPVVAEKAAEKEAASPKQAAVEKQPAPEKRAVAKKKAAAETAAAKSSKSQKKAEAETAKAESTPSQKQDRAKAASAADTTSQRKADTETVAAAKTTPQKQSVAASTDDKTTPAVASAKAVLDVQGMSCSGCINEIKGSLAEIEGVENVLVDLSSGKVEVYYDAEKLKDVDDLAPAITAVGYPATLKQTQTEEEVAKQNTYLAKRSKLYIAAVGDWEISRKDFDMELAHAKSRYEKIYGENVFASGKGKALLQNLQSQVVSRLINEGIQMQEVRKSGYKLPPGAFKTAFKDFLKEKGMKERDFKAALKSANYDEAYFMKKFENRITINEYVKENVLSPASNETEKQQQFLSWYNNARLMADVVFYDKTLEAAVNSTSRGSSCGSNCSRQ